MQKRDRLGAALFRRRLPPFPIEKKAPSGYVLFPSHQKSRRCIMKKTLAFLFLTLLAVAACGHRQPQVHLSSDVCLINQGQSSKEEVLAYLGPPSQKREIPGGEEWIYFGVHKSLLRKTPYVGEWLGHEEVESAVVTFSGDIVKTCSYRIVGSKPPEESEASQ